jgi:poly-gamma-glutamate synthesis protein (capsule biosynthesis protein)
MIFTGDIAIPFINSITILIPSELQKQEGWFGNLEGGIINNSSNKYKQLSGVFNDFEALKQLGGNLNFVGFSLANNHIMDLTDIKSTTDYLYTLSIPYCGVGKDLGSASKPLIIAEKCKQIVILSFGWEVIQCEIASSDKYGVNPLSKSHVMNSIQKAILDYPNAKIIPYMHWSYELEAEPHPFERELARKMIDSGAAGVIGSHPHRVGGFEMYNGKPIVYSLGNWMFKQNYYFDSKLSFPDFCNLELAFEWDLSNDDFKFHFFNYSREKSELEFLRTEGKDSPTMRELTPFMNLSEKEYKKWYRENHYHKNKGLPIYYWDDSVFTVKMKNLWNKSRDYLLKLLLNKGK